MQQYNHSWNKNLASQVRRQIQISVKSTYNGCEFPGHPVRIPQVAMKLPSIMLACRLTQALSLLTQRRIGQRVPSEKDMFQERPVSILFNMLVGVIQLFCTGEDGRGMGDVQCV